MRTKKIKNIVLEKSSKNNTMTSPNIQKILQSLVQRNGEDYFEILVNET